MIQKAWELKLVRFASVGVLNTGLDFFMLNILVFAFGLPVLGANVISVCIGITISYFLNHHIVFRKNHPVSAKAYAKFFLITGLSVLLVQSAVIYFATPIVTHIVDTVVRHSQWLQSIPQTYIRALAVNGVKALAVLVGMVWNYLLYSKIVFANKEEAEQPKSEN